MKNASGKVLTVRVLMLFGLLTIPYFVTAQVSKKATLTGKVTDAETGAALNYATVQIINSESGTLSTGGISNDEGLFSIEVAYGKYHVLIDFIGYRQMRSEDFFLTRDNPQHDLGVVKLNPSTSTLDEVVVQAERSSMELSLDKKIFNVGTDLGNAGMSAAELLNNIPSITVDGEGNVKLRGNNNVRILVDGKPSGLVSFKGGSGLRQLQGSLIEKVEIITNPSARYEAEGMAGIINIVLKKERKEGFNGSFEVTTGHPTNLGGAANMNYRHRKINFFINYGIAYRILPSVYTIYQEVYDNDTTFISEQTYDGNHTGFANNIRGGLDFFFNEKNILTGSYLYRRADGDRLTDLQYRDYLFTRENLRSITDRTQDEQEVEPNSEYVLNYKKLFVNKGHELNAEVRFLDNWENSDQLFTQKTYLPDGSVTEDKVQTSLNYETEKQLLFQADYTHPFGKEGKIEAGVRSSLRDMTNDYVVKDEGALGNMVPIDSLDNNFFYGENINAIYGIVGNKLKKISFQIGLRVEWTDIETILRETGEVNPRTYSNLFPSIHFTYKISKENDIQISYSRRVRRPVYNELSPFVTYSDNRNFFSGNPDLNPAFSNVFELGHVNYFEKGSIASSIYYRQTEGTIFRIRLVDGEGFSNTRPENLKSEDAYGAEFTTSYTPFKWWKVDFNFNFFRAITDGRNIDSEFTSDTYTWFIRKTSRFNLSADSDLQLRINYEAPQKTPQGRMKSLYYLDLAFKKDIFHGKGSITFNVSDIFNTQRTRTITRGDGFYSYNNAQRIRRQINLTLSYRLKN